MRFYALVLLLAWTDLPAQFDHASELNDLRVKACTKAGVRGVAEWHRYAGMEPGVENYILQYKLYDRTGRRIGWLSSAAKGFQVHLHDTSGTLIGYHAWNITRAAATFARCEAYLDSAWRAASARPMRRGTEDPEAKERTEQQGDTLWVFEGDTARRAQVTRIFFQGGRDTMRIDHITYSGGRITDLRCRYQIMRKERILEEGDLDLEGATLEAGARSTAAAVGMYITMRSGGVPLVRAYLAGKLKGLRWKPDYRNTLDEDGRLLVHESYGYRQRITNTYDGKGRLVESRWEPDARTVAYAYDKRGLPLTETSTEVKGGRQEVVRFEYSFWK